MSFSDLWAGLALVVSIYAAHKTIKFNERQKSLIESQERLNKLLLKKEETESLAGRKADLGVNFIKLGGDHYRLKVWNKGKAPARNVKIAFPEGNDLIPDWELTSKFPLRVVGNASVRRTHSFCSYGNEKQAYRTLRMVRRLSEREREDIFSNALELVGRNSAAYSANSCAAWCAITPYGLFRTSPQCYISDMTTAEDIEKAVEQLAPRELARFRAWFEAFDAQQFDTAIERDARAGKLDAHAEEALAAHRAGRSREL